jgi:hypothetical protein
MPCSKNFQVAEAKSIAYVSLRYLQLGVHDVGVGNDPDAELKRHLK